MKYNRPLIFLALPAQAALLLAVVGVVVIGLGWAAGLAALFGGAVSLVTSGLLAWRWWRGLSDYHCDGPRHLQSFRRSARERFFVVLMLMAAGLFGLHLQPGFLLMGFIAGQLAWLLAMAVLKAS